MSHQIILDVDFPISQQHTNLKYDLEGHSNNVKELVNSLGFKKFNLVVHDWGGAIGLSAFRDEFERINKLVLLNTAAFLS